MQPYPPDSECQTRLSWDDSGAESYEVHRLVWWDANSWFYKTGETAGTSCSGGTCHFDESGDHRENATLADTPCPLQINAGANFLANSCDPELWQAFYVIARDHTASGTPIRSAPSEIVWFNCPDAAASAMLWPQQSEREPITLYAQAEVCEPASIAESFALLAADVTTDADDRATPRAPEPAIAAEWLSPPATLGQSSSNPPYRVFNVHVDHLGSTRRLTNPWGTVVEEHDFLPFGEEIAPVYSRGGKMFTGHERDGETGLDYMLARFYSNAGARFLSTDPVLGSTTNSASWNRYVYVLNNPIAYNDPTGRTAEIGDAAGQTLAAVADGVRTWEADAVQLRIDGTGTDLITSINPDPINDYLASGLGQHIGPSENLAALAEAVNSDATIVLHTATDTFTRSGAALTLGESEGVETAVGHTVPPFASDDGNTQVYVRSDQSGADRTSTMHHELRAHGVRAMHGVAAGHGQPGVDEDALNAEAQARVNYATNKEQ